MNSRDLLQVWFELECIGFNSYMGMFRIPGSTCDDIGYVVGVRPINDAGAYQYARFREDLPPSVALELWVEMRDDVLENEDGVWEVLVRNGYTKNELRREITYTFDKIPSIITPDVGKDDLENDALVVQIDNRIVSSAWSIRSNDRAEEIAVETHGDFRRRGYGKQVVAQWVRRTLDRGKIPIYSHRKGNLESMALALSVGAIPFVEVVSYH